MTRRLSVAVLCVGLSACQCGGTAGNLDGGATGGGSGGDAGALDAGGGGGGTGGGTGGGGAGSLDGGLADFCATNGPVPVQVGGTTECTGDLGKRVFTFAFCSCTDVTANNAFNVGTVAGARDGGGSLGVNGSFTGSNQTRIGGTLWASGSVTSTNALQVGRDLACSDATLSSGAVGHDLRSEGDVTANGTFRVGGTVTSPGTVTGVTAVGGVVTQAVTVAPPCDCAHPVDVGSLVSFFHGVADNTARGVPSSALTSNTPVNLTLECGRYFFSGVNASAGVLIHTHGRVVIAIEGDLTTSNSFTVVPEVGSELDLFVSGSVTFSNSVTLGDDTRPWATRLYVGGGTLTSSNQLQVAANVYAPNATFTASNLVHIQGALFAHAVASSNNFTVDYDDGILGLAGCASADAGCTSAHDCGNPTPACVDGLCGKCQTNADCAAPLWCDAASGTCFEGVN
jgi:hypothetical protein